MIDRLWSGGRLASGKHAKHETNTSDYQKAAFGSHRARIHHPKNYTKQTDGFLRDSVGTARAVKVNSKMRESQRLLM